MSKPTKKPTHKSPDGKRHPSFAASWLKVAKEIRSKAKKLPLGLSGDLSRRDILIVATACQNEGERLRKIKR
jgi:hypothetical protein